MWHNPNLKAYPFDLTMAAQMLEDAGYTDPKNTGVRSNSEGLRLELNYFVLNRWPEEMRAASQVQQWFSQIGVKLNVQAMDADTITAYNYPVWKYDIYFWGWKVGPDISKRLWVLTTEAVTAEWSASGWSDSTYDDLWTQQSTELDPQKRQAIIWKMQEYLLDQSPEIPFYHMTSIAAYRLDTFTGYIPMTGGILSETNIWSWMSVHLVTPPMVTTAVTEPTTAPVDYTPWIVAAIAIIVAVAALGYATRRKRKAE
jgi:peptide/nickel transport system substrate-binding protein